MAVHTHPRALLLVVADPRHPGHGDAEALGRVGGDASDQVLGVQLRAGVGGGGAEPLAAAGGRWVLVSSWALALSASFWAGRCVETSLPGSPLAEKAAPLLELGWPLTFGTATFSA